MPSHGLRGRRLLPALRGGRGATSSGPLVAAGEHEPRVDGLRQALYAHVDRRWQRSTDRALVTGSGGVGSRGSRRSRLMPAFCFGRGASIAGCPFLRPGTGRPERVVFLRELVSHQLVGLLRRQPIPSRWNPPKPGQSDRRKTNGLRQTPQMIRRVLAFVWLCEISTAYPSAS